MNKLPENSDQTKNVKKSPSITRIATRGIINIFVPLMETRLITNSVQHMLEQQKRRLDRFRQVNNKRRNSTSRGKKLCRPAICQ